MVIGSLLTSVLPGALGGLAAVRTISSLASAVVPDEGTKAQDNGRAVKDGTERLGRHIDTRA